MSKPTNDTERLKQALKGIKEDLSPTDLPELASPLMAKLTDPPTYIVQMLLCSIAGFKSSREDKATWAIEVEFEGVQFKVRDWKRSTWSICSTVDTPHIRETANALHRKLISAGSLMNQIMRPNLLQQVNNGQFYIKNSFSSARRPYEYFRDVLSAELLRLTETPNKPIAEEPNLETDQSTVPEEIKNSGIKITLDRAFTDYVNKLIQLEEVISHNASAMIAFFFSYTELLFDVLFAFEENRGITYLKFRQLDWAERFKTVLPVSTDHSLRSIYEQLLDIRRTTRNTLFHGLWWRVRSTGSFRSCRSHPRVI